MNPISAAFEPMFGKPSWQVVNFHGSMLILDFGTPSVDIGQTFLSHPHIESAPPSVLARPAHVHGEWTLTIKLCEWTLRLAENLLAHSESPEPTMSRALRLLRGQALTGVRIEPDTGATEFNFDLEATLQTRPCDWEPEIEPYEQWTLMFPDNQYIAVRDDGTFSANNGDTSPDDFLWLTLPAMGES